MLLRHQDVSKASKGLFSNSEGFFYKMIVPQVRTIGTEYAMQFGHNVNKTLECV